MISFSFIKLLIEECFKRAVLFLICRFYGNLVICDYIFVFPKTYNYIKSTFIVTIDLIFETSPTSIIIL